MEEEYLTIKEFSKLIKLHPETIRRLIREKKIIALKPGNVKTSHYRIPRFEFERLLIKQQYGVDNGNTVD